MSPGGAGPTRPGPHAPRQKATGFSRLRRGPLRSPHSYSSMLPLVIILKCVAMTLSPLKVRTGTGICARAAPILSLLTTQHARAHQFWTHNYGTAERMRVSAAQIRFGLKHTIIADCVCGNCCAPHWALSTDRFNQQAESLESTAETANHIETSLGNSAKLSNEMQSDLDVFHPEKLRNQNLVIYMIRFLQLCT